MILYKLITILLTPFIHIYIFFRVLQKKEDYRRVKERFGFSSQSRPQGFLIWVNAVSLGEALTVIPLIEKMHSLYPHVQFLFTTTTVSSTTVILPRLPSYCIHQYAPLDDFFSAKRFLKNWQPNLTFFIESELWPNLIHSTKNYGKILLLNARMSDKSFNLWKYNPFFIKSILTCFDKVISQSQKDSLKLTALGSSTPETLPNLKFAYAILNFDNEPFKYKSHNPILLAASTHPGDEELLINAYQLLRLQSYKITMMIAPRHPNRKDSIIKLLNNHKLTYGLRTNQDFPKDQDVFIIDTLGELNKFYTISDMVFVGGSLNHGGHNPIEPAYFKNIIFFGPNMSNFYDIAEKMIESKSAIRIFNEESLASNIRNFLNNKDELEEYKSNAYKVANSNIDVLEKYIERIKEYVPNT